jgi:Holliday junction resolvasome RuvABC endonuclease subunit
MQTSEKNLFIVRKWRDREVEHKPKGEAPIWFHWKFVSTGRSIFSNRRKVYYELRRARTLLKTILADRDYVWGLDSSFKGTGLSITNLRTGYVMLDRFTTHTMASLVDRSCSLIEWLGCKYDLYKPAIILMESTFFMQGKAESLILTKLNHALEVGLYSMGGALYKAVAPTALKKYIVGTGPAAKSALQTVLQKQLGFMIHDYDLSDGMGLGIMAKDLYRLIMEFPIDKYSINDSKALCTMVHDIGDFLGEEKKAEVFFSLLYGNSNNMFGITAMLPDIKISAIERESPTFIRHDPNAVKKLKPRR